MTNDRKKRIHLLSVINEYWSETCPTQTHSIHMSGTNTEDAKSENLLMHELELGTLPKKALSR